MNYNNESRNDIFAYPHAVSEEYYTSDVNKMSLKYAAAGLNKSDHLISRYSYRKT